MGTRDLCLVLMLCSIREPTALAGPGCTTVSSLPEPPAFRRALQGIHR